MPLLPLVVAEGSLVDTSGDGLLGVTSTMYELMAHVGSNLTIFFFRLSLRVFVAVSVVDFVSYKFNASTGSDMPNLFFPLPTKGALSYWAKLVIFITSPFVFSSSTFVRGDFVFFFVGRTKVPCLKNSGLSNAPLSTCWRRCHVATRTNNGNLDIQGFFSFIKEEPRLSFTRTARYGLSVIGLTASFRAMKSSLRLVAASFSSLKTS